MIRIDSSKFTEVSRLNFHSKQRKLLFIRLFIWNDKHNVHIYIEIHVWNLFLVCFANTFACQYSHCVVVNDNSINKNNSFISKMKSKKNAWANTLFMFLAGLYLLTPFFEPCQQSKQCLLSAGAPRFILALFSVKFTFILMSLVYNRLQLKIDCCTVK